MDIIDIKELPGRDYLHKVQKFARKAIDYINNNPDSFGYQFKFDKDSFNKVGLDPRDFYNDLVDALSLEGEYGISSTTNAPGPNPSFFDYEYNISLSESLDRAEDYTLKESYDDDYRIASVDEMIEGMSGNASGEVIDTTLRILRTISKKLKTPQDDMKVIITDRYTEHDVEGTDIGDNSYIGDIPHSGKYSTLKHYVTPNYEFIREYVRPADRVFIYFKNEDDLNSYLQDVEDYYMEDNLKEDMKKTPLARKLDDLKDKAKKIQQILEDDAIYADVYPMNDRVEVYISMGDWKHDHLAAKSLIRDAFGDEIESIESDEEDNGQDTYDAYHKIYFKEPSLEEAYDEDKPFTKKEVYDELKRETYNFKDESGYCYYGFKSEASYAVEILSKHYEQVDMEDTTDPLLPNQKVFKVTYGPAPLEEGAVGKRSMSDIKLEDLDIDKVVSKYKNSYYSDDENKIYCGDGNECKSILKDLGLSDDNYSGNHVDGWVIDLNNKLEEEKEPYGDAAEKIAKKVARKLKLSKEDLNTLIHDINNLRGEEWLDQVKEIGDDSLVKEFKEVARIKLDEAFEDCVYDILVDDDYIDLSDYVDSDHISDVKVAMDVAEKVKADYPNSKVEISKHCWDEDNHYEDTLVEEKHLEPRTYYDVQCYEVGGWRSYRNKDHKFMDKEQAKAWARKARRDTGYHVRVVPYVTNIEVEDEKLTESYEVVYEKGPFIVKAHTSTPDEVDVFYNNRIFMSEDKKYALSQIRKYIRDPAKLKKDYPELFEDLIQSDSEDAFKKNIATEIKAGKSPKQAAAIAYSVKDKNKKMKEDIDDRSNDKLVVIKEMAKHDYKDNNILDLYHDFKEFKNRMKAKHFDVDEYDFDTYFDFIKEINFNKDYYGDDILEEGVGDAFKKAVDKVTDKIQKGSYLLNKTAVDKNEFKSQKAAEKKDTAIQDKAKAQADSQEAIIQKEMATTQLKDQAAELKQNQADGKASTAADVERRQGTLDKYRSSVQAETDAKKAEDKAQKTMDRQDKKKAKADKKVQKKIDRIDKGWQDTLARYGLSESLNQNEMRDFLQKAQEIGLKTLGDIDNFIKREALEGEDPYETIKRYRMELGDDFEIKENLEEDLINYDDDPSSIRI